VFARLAYDAYGEGLNIVEEVDVEKERTFFEYILLHREVLNLATFSRKECKNSAKIFLLDTLDIFTGINARVISYHCFQKKFFCFGFCAAI